MNFANITEQFSHSLYSVYEIFTEGTIRALPTSWVPPHGKYMNEHVLQAMSGAPLKPQTGAASAAEPAWQAVCGLLKGRGLNCYNITETPAQNSVCIHIPPPD